MTSPATPSEPAPGATGAAGTGPTSSSARPVATTPSAPIKLTADTAKALQGALAAEQVAVWAYDLVAAYDPADAALIATIRDGHLARREATATLLVSGGSTAAPPAPSYTLPNPVADVTGARTLSATVENDCAAAWRAVIGATDNTALRNTALGGLSDAAVWSTRMKLAAKAKVVTVPFPGQS